MQIFRFCILALFVLLALGLIFWQGLTLYELGDLGNFSNRPEGGILYLATLCLLIIEYLVFRFFGPRLKQILSVITWPIHALLLGLLRIVMGKGTSLKRLWPFLQSVLALGILNLFLPIQITFILWGTEGIQYSFAAIALQFFLFVDWYLGRVLFHSFSNAASAFISFRYLRKRPMALASIIGVAAGIGVLIVVNSIMNGFVKDYREQIRGSLSHVLIYSQPESLYASSENLEQEVWRYYYKRIQDSDKSLSSWQHALSLVQNKLRDGERPEKTSSMPGGRFPDSEIPQRPDPEPEIEDLLAQLDSPEGWQERHLLSDIFPTESSLPLATPENIWLSFISNPEERQNYRERIRSEVTDTLFLPRLQANNTFLRRAVRKHPNFAAASPRIQNFAPINGLESSNQFEASTSILAVDPQNELKISSIGEYAARSELQRFIIDQHVKPLIAILNFLLVFEDPQSAPENRELSAVLPIKQTEGTNQTQREHNFRVYWRPHLRLLEQRYYVERNSEIVWSEMNRIRFRPGSPGKKLLKLLESKIKALTKTSHGEDLKPLFQETQAELLEFIQDWVEASGSSEKELRKRGTPEDKHYPGDAAALVYLKDYFIDGTLEAQRYILYRFRDSYFRIIEDNLTILENLEIKAPEHYLTVTKKIAAKLESFFQGTFKEQDSTRALNNTLRKKLESIQKTILLPYLEKHRKTLDDLDYEWDLNLLNPLLRLQESDDFILPHFAFMKPSLSQLLKNWDQEWQEVQKRYQAYKTILPLRTRLLLGETPDEYLTRARFRLPFQAQHEVPAHHISEFTQAKTFVRHVLTSFLKNRLEQLPKDQKSKFTQNLLQAYKQHLLPELRTEINQSIQSSFSQAKTIEELQAQLFDVLDQLQTKIDHFLDTQFKNESDAFEDFCSPLYNHAIKNEYWSIRAPLPGLLIGDALASRMRLRFGDKVNLMVIHRSHDEEGKPRIGAEEQEFQINAFYRSGIFEDNLHTMYTDYHSYARLLGASTATYVFGVKLKDHTQYDGKPYDLKKEFEETLLQASKEMFRIDSKTKDTTLSLDPALFSQGLPPPYNSRVSVWELERAKLLKAVEREKTILTLLLTLIIVLAGIVILIVVYLTVIEKVKDIGILKSLGASPWGIRSIFMFNALFIGLFGTLLGAFLGILISQNLNPIEDWVDTTFGVRLFPPDVYYLTYIPSVKGLELLRLALDIAAPTIMWSFFCGIVPAMIASSKEAVEALHYE